MWIVCDKWMTCMAKASQEAAVMFEVCANAFNGCGLEWDMLEAGTTMYPNQPGAK